jgi:hypothetical protein
MDYKIYCENQFILNKIKYFFKNERLNINNLQTYQPIMNDFLKNENNNNIKDDINTSFINFCHRYMIKDIIKEKSKKEELEYNTKIFYNVIIFDKLSKKYFKDKIFIKINSILDPILLLKGKYELNNNIKTNLPFNKKKYDRKLKKINDKNNSAYVETFTSFLLSKLTENNLCPNFPKYYGSYCGEIKNYWVNISDDYDMLKDNTIFKNNIKKKK